MSDPKPRDIHKATVRDRVVHHAIYRQLYPYFDHIFLFDAFSCRRNKGTHRALNRFRAFARKVSRNNTRTCWVLKCDIQKFFASIDQATLMALLRKSIMDEHVLWLFERVITSFHTTDRPGIGLPLGNVTSQLLINIYMHELDAYIKRTLRARHYVRYADDFVILSSEYEYLQQLIPKIARFLTTRLKLSLHPRKLSITTLASGVDFLGWVHFPGHRVLRTSTKRRIVKRLQENYSTGTIASYRGLLSHGNTYKLAHRLDQQIARRQSTKEPKSPNVKNF
ncbi:MAG: reverse transcriptase/maturase family protein [Candidatus Andersenbacteria bacterium]